MNENQLRRQTILVDNDIYEHLEYRAIDDGVLFYKYLNRIFARHLGIPVPEYLKNGKVGNRNPERHPKKRARKSQRQTVLVDMRIWKELRSRAIIKQVRLYKYVNSILARSTQTETPKYLKHEALGNPNAA